MRFFLTILLVILLTSAAHSQQFPFELWHEGKIVTESGDTLKGLVNYNMQTDLLQLQVSKRLESYTARKVLFCEIFDATVKRYRQFYALPYALTGEYKAPVFFELLSEGKLTLLTREYVEYRTFTYGYGFGSYTRLVLVQRYFLLKENGSIQEFRGKKSDWIDQMGSKGEEVNKFARQNRLSFEDKYEITQIVDFYNSFFLKK
jgi:hypothetical protein